MPPPVYAAIALAIVAIAGWFVNVHPTIPVNIRAFTNVVIGLVVVGILLWLINTYIPMAQSIKTILNIVVVIAVCVGVLKAFGIWGDVVRLWGNITNRRYSH